MIKLAKTISKTQVM